MVGQQNLDVNVDVGEGCLFGIVPVTIESVTKSSVTFRTRSEGMSRDPNQCLLRSFTVPLTEVYLEAIPGAPPAVPMMPGATGNLFLSRDAAQTQTADGFGIYGVDHVVFKYPRCGAASGRSMSTLSVVPRSIVLHGFVGSQEIELDLLGEDAALSQDIRWTGAGEVEVRLSAGGAQRLSTETVIRVWPTRLLVHGSPALDPGVSGSVDVLDHENANVTQHLCFAQPGAVIQLSLTEDGVGLFHMTPQALADLSTSAPRKRSHG